MPLVQIWQNSPLIWAMPCGGSLYKDTEERHFFSLLSCSCLDSKSIFSLALEPTSLEFQHQLKTSRDTQPWGLSNFWILRLPFIVSYCSIN